MEMEKQFKSVIYFEDERDMVELVRLVLGREGYSVEGAFEGKTGLESIPPNAVRVCRT